MTDMTVPNTILSQLGGRRFIAMTGSKDFVGGENYLMFKVGRNSTSINKIKITLTTRDDYTVEFMRITMTKRGFEIKVLETVEGVYADNLSRVFEQKTGLMTSL